MYQCPNCGSNVNPGARFCATCAFDLSQFKQTVPVRDSATTARACQRCGTAVAPGAQFCPVCSAPLGVTYGPGRTSNRTPLIIGAVVLSVVLIAGIITLILLLSRSGDSNDNSTSANTNTQRGPQPPNSGPTKERAAQTLRDFLAAIKAGDLDKAISMAILPPDTNVERAKEQLKDAERVDLSSTGIDILAQRGTWGKAKDVFPNQSRLNQIVTKSGLPADSFYSLSYRDAFALFYWDGKQFKIVDGNKINDLDRSS